MYGAAHGHPALVTTLLEANADVNHRSTVILFF